MAKEAKQNDAPSAWHDISELKMGGREAGRIFIYCTESNSYFPAYYDGNSIHVEDAFGNDIGFIPDSLDVTHFMDIPLIS